ncbi:ankyrin repeat domain-containing protein [Stenotrophomonas maltophilia]|uniref:ankyrin repeat domain-containing protein n=1 Tax=Stenotrophomonas maltophilia TaxID=40324 RepID=UPI003CFD399E
MVRRLIEAGADPALGNPRGETPLHVAAQHKRAQCCLELMAAGADPGQLDREGRKPGDAHREKAREQVHGL